MGKINYFYEKGEFQMKKILSNKIFAKQILFCCISFLGLFGAIYYERLAEEFLDMQTTGYIILLKIIGILLILFGCDLAKNYIGNVVEKEATLKMQTLLYKKALMKKENRVQKGTGEILYNLTEDMYKMMPWYTVGRMQLYISIIQLIVLIVYMLTVDWTIGMIALGLIGVSMICSNYMSKAISQQRDEKQQANAEISQFMIESIKNICVIKQLHKEDYFGEKYETYVQKKYKKIINRIICSQAFYIVQYVIAQEMLPVLILFIGVVFIMTGKSTIGIAVVMTDIVTRISRILQAAEDLLPEKYAAEKIYKRLDIYMKDEKESGDLAEKFETLEVNIEHFSYASRKKVLLNTNLKVKRGDVCLVKGKSGSGKSTLFHLIARFLTVQFLSGEIKYNGKNIFDYSIDNYYNHVALVEQTTFLINGTFLENILLGAEYSDAEIQEVLQICELENFIKKKGIQYIIQNDGKNISGGERQRIGLARFLLRKPDLLLLDEVTSSLDRVTRNRVAENVVQYALKYDITLLIITHNDEFDKYADEIYMIEA